MELIYQILLYSGAVGILSVIAYKLTEYNFAWWLRNQRAGYLMKNWYGKWVFLEIKLPREIHKSPAAMEIVFNALYQTLGYKPGSIFEEARKETKWWKRRDKRREEFFLKYLQGSMRLWSSLEIVSEEGQIKFYVVTPGKNAEIFKSYAYSQFPGIEVTEVEDYALKYQYKNLKDTPLYVGRYVTSQRAKDAHGHDISADYLPIKTYVDYGLDKDPKEEYKIDPLTPLLESMAAAGPGETFIYQILIRPTLYEKEWKQETKNRMDQILEITRDAKGKIISQGRQMIALHPHEKNEMEIIQRNIEKNGWDCIVRMFYVVDKDVATFSLNKGVFAVVNAMKSFNKPGFNTFGFKTITIDSDTPFLDPKGLRSEGLRKMTWKFFKLRTGYYIEAEGHELEWRKFFYKWWVGGSFDWAMAHWNDMKEYWHAGTFKHRGEALDFILNTEELATMWHFPGKAFGNTSARVDSSKSEAPRNLPI